MDYDEFMDEQNPFDGMDYHEILDWASEHESELEAYGIDPSTIGEYLKNDFDGGKFSQVDTERFQMYSGEQVISHLMQCTPDVTYQAVQTFFIPFLLSLSVQVSIKFTVYFFKYHTGNQQRFFAMFTCIKSWKS